MADVSLRFSLSSEKGAGKKLSADSAANKAITV